MARSPIFVDTGAWFALSVATDPDHGRANSFVAQNRQRLSTTDYVVDELLTLFARRRCKAQGISWLQDVLCSGTCELIRVESADFNAACEIYSQFSDKEWSFTDCTSYVVMRRLHIVQAFAFDEHFRQFATVQVLP